MSGHNHWPTHVQKWGLLGPPLRPHPADLAVLAADLPVDAPVLLLGVTEEYVALPGRLTGIDQSAPIVAARKNLFAENGHRALVGDWRSLSFPPGSFQACVGDGSFNMLHYAADYETVFGEVRRVLQAGGRLCTRVFVTPDTLETVDEVLRQPRRFGGDNFNAFKWRLAMAMVQENGHPNIVVQTIHERFCALIPEPAHLAAATGWPLEQINTINNYRNSSVVYSFPTQAQFVELAHRCGWRIERVVRNADYPLAERCPTFILS